MSLPIQTYPNDNFIEDSSKNRALAALFLCASEEFSSSRTNEAVTSEDASLSSTPDHSSSSLMLMMNCNSMIESIAAASFSLEDGVNMCRAEQTPKFVRYGDQRMNSGSSPDTPNEEDDKVLSVFCGIKKSKRGVLAEEVGDIRPHCKALCENEVIRAGTASIYPSRKGVHSPRPSLLEYFVLNNQASAIAALAQRCCSRGEFVDADEEVYQALLKEHPKRQSQILEGGEVFVNGSHLTMIVSNLFESLPPKRNYTEATLRAYYFLGSRASSESEKMQPWKISDKEFDQYIDNRFRKKHQVAVVPNENNNNNSNSSSTTRQTKAGFLIINEVLNARNTSRSFNKSGPEIRKLFQDHRSILATPPRPEGDWNGSPLIRALRKFLLHRGPSEDFLYSKLSDQEESDLEDAVSEILSLFKIYRDADPSDYAGIAAREGKLKSLRLIQYVHALRRGIEMVHDSKNSVEEEDDEEEEDEETIICEEEEEEEELDEAYSFFSFLNVECGRTDNPLPVGVFNIYSPNTDEQEEQKNPDDGIPRLQTKLPEAVQEKAIILFQKDHRLDHGQPCFAPREVFEKRFEAISSGVLEGWSSPFAWAIGGSVVSCLQPTNIVNENSLPPSQGRDIDIVFCGLEKGGVLLEILRFDQFMRKVHPHHLACCNTSTITYVLPSPKCSIQIILGSWPTIQDCLHHADVDCCAVAASLDTSELLDPLSSSSVNNNHTFRRKIVATLRGLHSWIYRINIPSSHAHGVRGSPSYEERLVKYARREHFQVVHNTLEVDRESESFQDFVNNKDDCQGNLRMHKTSGLAWLYLVDIEKFKPNLKKKKCALEAGPTRNLWDIREEIEAEGFVESDGYGGTESGYMCLNLNHLPPEQRKPLTFGDQSKNGLAVNCGSSGTRFCQWFRECHHLVFREFLGAQNSLHISSLDLHKYYKTVVIDNNGEEEIKGPTRIRPREEEEDDENNDSNNDSDRQQKQHQKYDSSRDERILNMSLNREHYVECEDWLCDLPNQN